MPRDIYIGPMGSRIYAPCGQANWPLTANPCVRARIVEITRCSDSHDVEQVRGKVFVAFMHLVGPGNGHDFTDGPVLAIEDFLSRYGADPDTRSIFDSAVRELCSQGDP